jgi:hypothetical protein
MNDPAQKPVWRVVSAEERDALREKIQKRNAEVGEVSSALPMEELHERQRQTMTERGISPQDRLMLRDLLIQRYPDDWENALREHDIEAK